MGTRISFGSSLLSLFNSTHLSQNMDGTKYLVHNLPEEPTVCIGPVHKSVGSDLHRDKNVCRNESRKSVASSSEAV
jgi:hypothetical protein